MRRLSNREAPEARKYRRVKSFLAVRVVVFGCARPLVACLCVWVLVLSLFGPSWRWVLVSGLRRPGLFLCGQLLLLSSWSPAPALAFVRKGDVPRTDPVVFLPGRASFRYTQVFFGVIVVLLRLLISYRGRTPAPLSFVGIWQSFVFYRSSSASMVHKNRGELCDVQASDLLSCCGITTQVFLPARVSLATSWIVRARVRDSLLFHERLTFPSMSLLCRASNDLPFLLRFQCADFRWRPASVSGEFGIS